MNMGLFDGGLLQYSNGSSLFPASGGDEMFSGEVEFSALSGAASGLSSPTSQSFPSQPTQAQQRAPQASHFTPSSAQFYQLQQEQQQLHQMQQQTFHPYPQQQMRAVSGQVTGHVDQRRKIEHSASVSQPPHQQQQGLDQSFTSQYQQQHDQVRIFQHQQQHQQQQSSFSSSTTRQSPVLSSFGTQSNVPLAAAAPPAQPLPGSSKPHVLQSYAVPSFDQQGGVAMSEAAAGATAASHMQNDNVKMFEGLFSPEALLGLPSYPSSDPYVNFSRAFSVVFTLLFLCFCRCRTPEVSVSPAIRDAVRRYLQNPSQEKTVIILNSKVAQKSYGSEKRFFCPPPSVILIGDSWRQASDSDEPHDPTLNLGIEENGKDAQQAGVDHAGRAVFKNLFISDSDKRKNFALYLKALSPSGREFGVFRSRPVKVISKPSKKKQSAKNIDLCLTSGTTVSLFNRIRSQTVSTKYLGVDNGSFVAKTNFWDAFVITAHNKSVPSLIVFCVGLLTFTFAEAAAHGEDTFLHYGMEVVLRSTLTGMASDVLIVRKVEKALAVLQSDEPVSQLHKVAFQFKDADGMYLALQNDCISMQKAAASGPGGATISDAAAWTIVGTERVQYSFFEGLSTSARHVTPVPIVNYIKVQNKRLIEVYGENFSPSLTVWFAETPAVTRYRCEELVVCEPPPFRQVAEHMGISHVITTPVEVPIIMVRNDGVVYNTGKKYIYTAEPFSLSKP